mmetsp:Transcript_5323/g.10942  ORF Transcript_5323/g.10942 Transcript_5323/m.10942 type:complete len:255 (-) Transcript_5323:95-859(-)
MTKTDSTCCSKCAFGITFTFSQVLSVLVFAISVLPFVVDYDNRIEDYYPSFLDDLNLIITIWIRLHIVSASFTLFLGPIQILYGLLRKAGDSKVHKYLGYIYTMAMAISLTSSLPLVVLRYVDGNEGGAWVATPLICLIIYSAVTLYLGIKAVVQGDKLQHRRMLFRNYWGGVFVFVTFRMGVAIMGGSLETIVPSVFMVATWAVTEGVLWKFPESFADLKTLPSACSTNDHDIPTMQEESPYKEIADETLGSI